MPLHAMQEQLEYWRTERAAAELAGNAERAAQCVRFIQQCEMVIAALKEAASPPASIPDNDPRFFFNRRE